MSIPDYNKVTPEVVKELQNIIGPENVLTEIHDLLPRSMVHAVSQLSKWKQHIPEAVVLPSTADQIVKIIKLANARRIPLLPRSGGSAETECGLPKRGGIVVDMKKMNKIIELDEENMCVTVQPGISRLSLDNELEKRGYISGDDPTSFPVAYIGGRIAPNGWSGISGRYGHIKDMVLGLEVVLPQGDLLRIGGGGSMKVRKSSVGYDLKHLFIGSQGTLGIVTEATLEIFPKPEEVYCAYFGYNKLEDTLRTIKRFQRAGVGCAATWGILDYVKIEVLKRDSPAFISLDPEIRCVIWWTLYGTKGEVNAVRELFTRISEECNGIYLGREFSERGWEGRHEHAHLPLHARPGPACWHCEEPAVPFSEVPKVMERFHEICAKHQIDDWGVFMFSNSRSMQGDMMVIVDVAVDERDDKRWPNWEKCFSEFAETILQAGGTLSGAHGCTKAGDREFLPVELSAGGYELMKTIKRTLDPNNIMNPGLWELDSAYEEG